MNTNLLIALKLAFTTVWQHLNNSFIKESWLTILLACIVTLAMFIPDRIEHLTYHNDLIFKQGEWWRIFTAPFIHFSWDHFSWNMIVMLASSIVLEHLNRSAYLVYLPLAIFTTTLYEWYIASYSTGAGFSNIASGNFSLLLILFTWEGIRRKDFWVTFIPLIMQFLFIAHELGFIGSQSGWEFVSGRSISGAAGKEVKPGHIVGIITGLFIGLFFGLQSSVKKQSQNRH